VTNEKAAIATHFNHGVLTVNVFKMKELCQIYIKTLNEVVYDPESSIYQNIEHLNKQTNLLINRMQATQNSMDYVLKAINDEKFVDAKAARNLAHREEGV
jgi:hypothetical protein